MNDKEIREAIKELEICVESDRQDKINGNWFDEERFNAHLLAIKILERVEKMTPEKLHRLYFVDKDIAKAIVEGLTATPNQEEV